MTYKIGFLAEQPEEQTETTYTAKEQKVVPRKSVVQVYFPARGMTLAYFNDQFDLHRDDLVFVEGKLEGLRGRVVEVNYNFKIKLSDYKRVIAVADTDVRGELFMAGSHFVTFDAQVLSNEKVRSWYLPPQKEEDEFVSGNDDTVFQLNDLSGMKVSSAIADRGYDYYLENKVVYLSVDGHKGYAVVMGTSPYEVEFTHKDGEISGLVCSCFCSYTCKHEVAAMLQLREILDNIEKNYKTAYEQTGYFAAISKTALFSFVIDRKKTGSICL